MDYRIEKYKNCERFNEQYQDIYLFLLNAEQALEVSALSSEMPPRYIELSWGEPPYFVVCRCL